MAYDPKVMFSAFLAGSAVGAAAALLLAPQSGRRTQRMIRRRMEDAVEQFSEAGNRISDVGRDMSQRFQKLAGESARLFEKKSRALAG